MDSPSERKLGSFGQYSLAVTKNPNDDYLVMIKHDDCTMKRVEFTPHRFVEMRQLLIIK